MSLPNPYSPLYLTPTTSEDFIEYAENSWPTNAQYLLTIVDSITAEKLYLYILDMQAGNEYIAYASENLDYGLIYAPADGGWFVYDSTTMTSISAPSTSRTPGTKSLGVSGEWVHADWDLDPANVAFEPYNDALDQLTPLDNDGNVWYEQLRRNRQND